MKKKTILILAVLALVAVPLVAQAQTEFKLGGYIKMEGDWDSTQMNKNLTLPVLRNNDPNFHHGRLKVTAEGSRFNFTIKGPKLWGAQTSGLIEVDFDTNFNVVSGGSAGANIGSTSQFSPRLRHAMFRFNWPETELMLGQYWSMFSEFTPEGACDGQNQFTGAPNHRLPQIRLTQKFLGAWRAALLVGRPTDPADDKNQGAPTIAADTNVGNTGVGTAGQNTPAASSETPQIQALVGFEQDLWGKAAFYGVPRGFTAQIAAGWQRARYRAGGLVGAAAKEENAGGATPGTRLRSNVGATVDAVTGRVEPNYFQQDQQYLNHWAVMGSLFIPVIPTYSANLAGTASISTQWYIGAGLNFIGEGTDSDSSLFHYNNRIVAGFDPARGRDAAMFDRQLIKRYGGYVQAQYYFTNQWYTNLLWGMSKSFGLSYDDSAALAAFPRSAGGAKTIFFGEPTTLWTVASATLWYRPIQALKFGIQYSYGRTNWWAGKLSPVPSVAPGGTIPQSNVNVGNTVADVGEDHRLMFAGFFYF